MDSSRLVIRNPVTASSRLAFPGPIRVEEGAEITE